MENLTISRGANNSFLLFCFLVKSFTFFEENLLFFFRRKNPQSTLPSIFAHSKGNDTSRPGTNEQISFDLILYIQFDSILRRAEELIKRTKQKREIRVRIRTNVAA